jgi:hypothetical protein
MMPRSKPSCLPHKENAYTCLSSYDMATLLFPHEHQTTHLSPACCFVGFSSDWTATMRYDDWDVILFAGDSHVPIQEFKTTCYSAQDSSNLSLTPLRVKSNSFADSSNLQRATNYRLLHATSVPYLRRLHFVFPYIHGLPRQDLQPSSRLNGSQTRKLCT